MMPFHLVIFPTDFLFYLLIVLGVGYAIWSARHEHLRAPWQLVARSKVGMITAIIVSIYLVVAMLDSIHLQLRLAPAEAMQTTVATQPAQKTVAVYGNTQSVLDLLLQPLATQNEQTYSAPFATRAYTQSVITEPDGTQVRGYAPLHYGNAALQLNASAELHNIIARIFKGFLFGTFLSCAFLSILTYGLAHHQKNSWRQQFKLICSGKMLMPWRTIYLTIAIISIILSITLILAMAYHILGTNQVGQDVFYESVKSIRTGLMLGTLTTLVTLPFSLILGIVAGYFGGWLDDIIQYLYTTLSSIPGVLLITAAILALEIYMENHPQNFATLEERADIRLLALCVILGITSWTNLCRILRAETLKLRELDFVQAAVALGSRTSVILWRHILPNVLHLILIMLLLDFSGLVLAEAVLSYVGVGVDPTTISWGNMINSARLELAREPIVWWPLTAAFVLMFVLVLAANLFSDSVRDAFNPRILD